MTDLHSHILPGIDDGSKNAVMSQELLDQCARQGVRSIALTSHFDSDSESLELFLTRRQEAFETLLQCLEDQAAQFDFKLGAEVFFSPQLVNMDFSKLCLEGTDLLLLELPVGYRPQFLRETLSVLQSEGVVPLIAHVERYPYILEDPRILAELIEDGAYAQVNAGSLLRGDKRAKMAMKLIKWGLVHVIASDTHSTDKRPPRLKAALDEIEKQFGSSCVHKMRDNAALLFSGGEPDAQAFHIPKKILGRWI